MDRRYAIIRGELWFLKCPTFTETLGFSGVWKMKSAQYYFIFKAWWTGGAGSWFHHRVIFSSSSFVALCSAVAGGLSSTTGSSTSGDIYVVIVEVVVVVCRSKSFSNGSVTIVVVVINSARPCSTTGQSRISALVLGGGSSRLWTRVGPSCSSVPRIWSMLSLRTVRNVFQQSLITKVCKFS